MLGKAVESEILDGKTYWFAPSGKRRAPTKAEPTVYLLPNYDEYLNALRDRSLALDPAGPVPTTSAFVGVPHQLVIDGILRGAWKRVTTARNISLVVRPFRALNRKELDALDRAVKRFARFVQMPTTITVE